MPVIIVIFAVAVVIVANAWGVQAALICGLVGVIVALLRSGRSGARNPGAPEQTDSPAFEAPRVEPQAVLDALPMGALIVGADRTIVMANADARTLFGLEALAGQPAAVLRAPRLLDGIEATFADRQPQTFDLRLTRQDDLFLVAQINRIAEGAGDDLLIVLRDETAIRQAADLHRDFVANASHELKTPLAAASGLIETLLGPARNDPAATERFLGLLSDQTVRMHRLVEDLLSLNRIELNERVAPNTAVALGPIVDEAVAALEPVATAEGISLDVERVEPTPEVLADRGEIGQLVRNLIENAIKHGGTGGKVHVRVGFSDPARKGMVGVSVQDNGPGIAKEDLPRLTERFYRVNTRRSREKGGTGLGLAICKHIVARHRGQLEISSEVGQGSIFTAWLPTPE